MLIQSTRKPAALAVSNNKVAWKRLNPPQPDAKQPTDMTMATRRFEQLQLTPAIVTEMRENQARTMASVTALQFSQERTNTTIQTLLSQQAAKEAIADTKYQNMRAEVDYVKQALEGVISTLQAVVAYKPANDDQPHNRPRVGSNPNV
jgi:hypothetical protein